MVRRIANGFGKVGKADRLFRLLDQLHRISDRKSLATHLVRLAAHAGPIAGCPRSSGVEEELDMLAFRTPRWAARLAVDAGRPDCSDYPAIPAAVAALEGRPGRICIYGFHQHGRSIARRSRSCFP